MKIALVSPYDIAVPSGVNAHIAHLAREFRHLGHQVRVIAPSSQDPEGRRDEGTIIIGRPRPVPTGGSVARISVSPRVGGRVKQVLAEERFDVVHVHEPLVPFLPIQFLRFSDAVNVGTFHTARERGSSRLYSYSRYVLRRFFRRLDGKIAVSVPAARLVSRYFPGYFNIIPNGIDLESFQGPLPPPPPPVADGRPYVLFVGRFEKRKGLSHLLRAFTVLKRTHPAVRLVVVGEGRRRAQYQAWVEAHGLRDVLFTGYVTDQERNAYYRHATVFCAPNTGNESFGYILLEAMAAGRPIVATNIEGFANLITHGVEGLLVPPRDPEGLAAALAQVLDDADLAARLASGGAARAPEFAWPRVAQRVLSYYERLLYARRLGARAAAHAAGEAVSPR